MKKKRENLNPSKLSVLLIEWRRESDDNRQDGDGENALHEFAVGSMQYAVGAGPTVFRLPPTAYRLLPTSTGSV